MDNLSENIITVGNSNVTFKVEGREDCPGYLSPHGFNIKHGIVLIQEWWGMNKSITLTADTIAKRGFTVLCPDLYRGKVGKDREQAGHLMSGLDFQGAIKDISAAGEYLKSIGCDKVGLSGFCMGGALTIANLCTSDTFAGGVPFYGIPDLNYFNLANIKVPVQAHFGSLDQAKGFSDSEAARNLESKAKEAGIQFNLIMWEGGDHAFMNQDSSHYNPEIAEQALSMMVSFFKSIFCAGMLD
jgi:carboxymethylenebutenolidase